MQYRHLLYSTEDRVASIVLNRPQKMNAINHDLMDEIVHALGVADRDQDVRVITVSGAGGKAFSSGYDMQEPPKIANPTAIERRERQVMDMRLGYSAWDCSKPVIAVIDGYCFAGAFEFAMFCDVRYCSDASTFGLLEARFSSALTMIMPWLIGQRSRSLVFTGDRIDAAEAFRLGLVDKVFTKTELDTEAHKIAKRMSRVALSFLQLNKKAINQAFEIMGFRSAIQYGSELSSMMLWDTTPEGRKFNEIRRSEGLAAANHWRDGQFAPYE
jgi:enoyl-CoA hydratase/carnithine racemase